MIRPPLGEPQTPQPPAPQPPLLSPEALALAMAKGRWVSTHLTPCAPGMEMAGINAPERWVDQWNVTPQDAVAGLCKALRCGPQDIAIKALLGGDVGVMALSGQFRSYPLAYILGGLTLQEAQAGLEALQAGGQAQAPGSVQGRAA